MVNTQRSWHYHDENERRKWQEPEAILVKAGLTSGQIFIDLGSGDGFFALPAARIVGENGRVHALDSSKDAIDTLLVKARAEGLDNVEGTVGRGEDLVLCDGCADVVFFGIVLHDFDDPARVLANARRMIKSSGTLVNVDWKNEPMDLGPPLGIRFSTEKATLLIQQAGFSAQPPEDVGPYHYLILAKP
jgi:ubiquinone/menaquinone biosynthesis C-methylase UbiE